MSGVSNRGPSGTSGEYIVPADVVDRIADCLDPPLTEEQRRAVFSTLDGPRLVVAGAGSGKTALMAARMVAVACAGIPVEAILGLTFTRKAAAELSERVHTALRLARQSGLLDVAPGHPEVSTYHSFAQRLVRDSGLFAGIDPDLHIESEFNLLPLAADVVTRSGYLTGDHQLQVATAVRAMRKLDEECAEHAIEPAQVRELERARIAGLERYGRTTAKFADVLAASQQRILLTHVVAEYREAKRSAGVMDFADMLRLAHKAANHRAVQEHVAAQFKAVLLDEYQDTSVVQRKLLQTLFGTGHPVVAVGDPKQSIYGFRGAAAANIAHFPRHFVHADTVRGASVFPLSTNFRSAPEIVEVANASEAARWAESAGFMGSTLVSGRQETGRIDVAVHRTADDETRAVVSDVLTEISTGTSPDDILVLVRTNAEARRFTEELQRHGVPATSSDDLAMFDLPEVADLIAALEAVADPGANLQTVRLLAGARWRLGLRDLNGLGRLAATGSAPEPEDNWQRLVQAVADADPVAGASLMDAAVSAARSQQRSGLLSDEAQQRLSDFVAEYRQAARYAGEPVTDQLVRLMRQTGFDTEILLGGGASARVAAVEALLDAAGQYERAFPTGGVMGFLRAIRLAREYGVDPGFEPPRASGVVRVLTVHKAKGLQADVVFLPGFTEGAYDTAKADAHWTKHPGRLPHELREDREGAFDGLESVVVHEGALVPTNDKGVDALVGVEKRFIVEENARLVYVALTRARFRMKVTAHVWAPHRAKPRQPSAHLLALRELPSVRVGPWHEPADGESNPIEVDVQQIAFPSVNLGAGDRLREAAGLVWSAAAQRSAAASALDTSATSDAGATSAVPPSGLSEEELEQLRRWDADIAALLRERQAATATETTVALPDTLSVTGLQRLVAEPDAYARFRRRPMPQPPSRSADLGTRFHEWAAQRWEQRPLWAAEEFAADAEIDREDDEALQELIVKFEASQFAARRPFEVEVPFTVAVAGHPVTGRIDAVFEESDGTWLVLDWKTSAQANADEVQLAVYRIAWAKSRGVDPGRVKAGFYYVARDELVIYDELMDEASLHERIASALAEPDDRAAADL